MKRCCEPCLYADDDTNVAWATNAVPIRDPDGEPRDLHMCKRHLEAYRVLRERQAKPPEVVTVIDGGQKVVIRAGELA